MNSKILKGHWNELKGELKQHWSELTDDDLKDINGKVEELYGKLQKKYGYTKREVKIRLESFLEQVKNNYSDHLVGDAVRSAGDHVQRYSHHIADKADYVSEKTHNKINDELDNLVAYVRKKPIKSVLIGLVSGYVIGKIL